MEASSSSGGKNYGSVGVSAHFGVAERDFSLPPVQKAKGEVKRWDQQAAVQG